MGASPTTLSTFGILNPARVIYLGEYWRIISCNFLVSGLLELLSNLITLFFAGRKIEFQIGSAATLTLFTFSAIISPLMSIQLQRNVVTTGACAFPIALIGAGIVHHQVSLTQSPLALKKRIRASNSNRIESNTSLRLEYETLLTYQTPSHLLRSAQLKLYRERVRGRDTGRDFVMLKFQLFAALCFASSLAPFIGFGILLSSFVVGILVCISLHGDLAEIHGVNKVLLDGGNPNNPNFSIKKMLLIGGLVGLSLAGASSATMIAMGRIQPNEILVDPIYTGCRIYYHSASLGGGGVEGGGGGGGGGDNDNDENDDNDNDNDVCVQACLPVAIFFNNIDESWAFGKCTKNGYSCLFDKVEQNFGSYETELKIYEATGSC